MGPIEVGVLTAVISAALTYLVASASVPSVIVTAPKLVSLSTLKSVSSSPARSLPT